MGEGRSFSFMEPGHINFVEPVDVIPNHSNIDKPDSSWIVGDHVVYEVDEADSSLAGIDVQDVQLRVEVERPISPRPVPVVPAWDV